MVREGRAARQRAISTTRPRQGAIGQARRSHRGAGRRLGICGAPTSCDPRALASRS